MEISISSDAPTFRSSSAATASSPAKSKPRSNKSTASSKPSSSPVKTEKATRRLVAYLVGQPSDTNSPAVLRPTLESKLPDYMVPSAFVFLPAFPLTANGKIDRKALLALPPPVVGADAAAPHPQSEPVSDIERIIVDAWKDALGAPVVGLNDNFFDLGAHSLTVAEVHARLQNVLGREIDLVDLFQFSTVKALANHLAGSQPQSQVQIAHSAAGWPFSVER